VQNQNVQAYCQTELGNIYVVLSEFELAAQVYGQTSSRCLATGNRRSLAHAHTFMADAYARQAKLKLEQETLEKAAVIYQEFHDVSNLCGILLRLASVGVQRKNLLAAEQTLRDASKLCQQLHEVRFYFRLFHLFAIIAAQHGFHAKALRLYFMSLHWSAQLEAEVDVHELDFNRFDLEPIQASYSQLEIEQLKLEASNLSAGQTVQYALGQLEIFDDPPLSQIVAVQAI
jgi:tetratricopeptide (TPR) repeat protein